MFTTTPTPKPDITGHLVGKSTDRWRWPVYSPHMWWTMDSSHKRTVIWKARPYMKSSDKCYLKRTSNCERGRCEKNVAEKCCHKHSPFFQRGRVSCTSVNTDIVLKPSIRQGHFAIVGEHWWPPNDLERTTLLHDVRHIWEGKYTYASLMMFVTNRTQTIYGLRSVCNKHHRALCF